MPRIHETAEVSETAELGTGTSVWQYSHLREDCQIGQNCVIGRGAYIGPGVSVGDNCKIQNYALIYDPAEIGKGVFIGPAAILTNDVYPRAVAPDLSLKGGDDWQACGVRIGDGAAIGARAVIRAGVEIGKWALVAAGAVVIRDVAPYALVAGNPAVQKGWVGRTGKQLVERDGIFECDDTGDRFTLENGRLKNVS